MIISGKVVNPGQLRTLISLGSRSVVTGTGGFQVPTFTAFVDVYARWIGAHGADSTQAAIAGVDAPATVLIRYNAGLDRTGAVKLGSDWYEIVSIDDIQQRHEYMELKVRRAEAA
jgi:SPP1 family predicted phage head-tail adaptor